jgi:hypothetical protein
MVSEQVIVLKKWRDSVKVDIGFVRSDVFPRQRLSML